MSEQPRLVREYLVSLESAARQLPSDERAELVGDVREHLEIGLAQTGQNDEPAVRALLDGLGSPDEIVAAALAADHDAQSVTEQPRRRSASMRPLTIEERAMLALTVGSIGLPFIGPLLGLWIAAGSASWSLGQKRTAAAIVVVLLALPATIVLPGVAAGELNWAVGSVGFLLPFVPLSGLLAATYLFVSSSFVVSVSRRG